MRMQYIFSCIASLVMICINLFRRLDRVDDEMEHEHDYAAITNKRKNLIDLNDDCLIAILEHVSQNDLTSIALTCRRLRTVAGQVNMNCRIATIKCHKVASAQEENDELLLIGSDTRVSYADRLVRSSVDRQRLYSRFPYDAELRAKQHLTLFGHLIKEVDFDCWMELRVRIMDKSMVRPQAICDESLFAEIVERGADSLQRLTLRHFIWTPILRNQARPVLRRLTKYHSYRCTSTKRILPELIECTDLKISHESDMDFFGCHMVKLQRFSIIKINWIALDRKRMAEFLRRHQNLEYLQCHGTRKFDLDVIAGMHQLEELDINSFTLRNVDATALRCDKLKKLSLRIARSADIPLLLHLLADTEAVDTLEYVRIDCAAMKAVDIEGLCRFKHLKTVDLHGNRKYQVIPFALPALHVSERLALSGFVLLTLQLPPTVKAIELMDSSIGEIAFNALSQMTQLKRFVLQRCRYPENYRSTFSNIDRLETLVLTGVNYEEDRMEDFLAKSYIINSLGSSVSLQNLEIDTFEFDVSCLERYPNLRCIKMMCAEIYGDPCRLRCVEELHLQGDFLEIALKSLESTESLVKLHLYKPTCKAIEAIGRFHNLRELRIECNSIEYKIDYFRLCATNWAHLRDIKLVLRNGGEPSSSLWESVAELLCQTKTKINIAIEKFDIREIKHEEFKHVLWLCRQRNYKILMQVVGLDQHSLYDYLFEGDTHQYVEIMFDTR